MQLNGRNIDFNQIEGKTGTTKKRKILLIILGVLIVLAIIFCFVFGNTKLQINEYNGTKDLEFVKQIIEDNEYYMFEDNGQKYILFKMSKEVYKPQKVEIKSAKIYTKSYTEDRKLSMNVNIEADTTKQNGEPTNDISIFNEDSIFFVQKINSDCSGLIVNNIEYVKFKGGIVTDMKTQKVGYIDSDNNMIIPTEYSNIEEMDNSYYDVQANNKAQIDYTNYLKTYKEGIGYGIATKEGKTLIECQYATIVNFDAYTFAVTRGNEANGSIGIVDLYGNVIQEFKSGGIFDDSEEFEKYAIVTLNNKKGVMDRNLNVIVPIQYDKITMRNFEEDSSNGSKYLFATENNGQYEVFDENGQSAVNESLNTISQLFGKDMNSIEMQEIYKNILNSKMNSQNE